MTGTRWVCASGLIGSQTVGLNKPGDGIGDGTGDATTTGEGDGVTATGRFGRQADPETRTTAPKQASEAVTDTASERRREAREDESNVLKR